MMIRCIVADDHPAVRTGLIGLLRLEPGFVLTSSVDNAADAVREVVRYEPDLALIDYNLPDSDGLLLCCDLKALETPPRVVLYSAFASPRLALAATVAGAEAVLAKGAPVEEMFEVLRAVGRGAVTQPKAAPNVMARCAEGLDAADMPLFGMVMARTPLSEIAGVMGQDLDCVRLRLRRLVEQLAPRQTSI